MVSFVYVALLTLSKLFDTHLFYKKNTIFGRICKNQIVTVKKRNNDHL